MQTRVRHVKLLTAALTLLLMGMIWLVFAPVQFGGRAIYIIVSGNSMEPVYHRGDLVLLRQAAQYQVGDIVTYRHPEIGPVIHRIIGREGNHLILQGDNNGWLDSYQPVQTDILGKAWVHLPSAGIIIAQLRSPWSMALLVIAMGVISMSTVTSSNDHRQPDKHRRRRIRAGHRTMRYLSATKETVLGALVFLALASCALALFAFTRPVIRTVTDELSYEQTGVFTYTAPAPPGVYDTDMVQTGEPLFRQLTDRFTVDFAYRLLTEQPGNVTGTYQLVAEVSDSNGWKRTIELQPATEFDSTVFTASGTVDLQQVQVLIDTLEQRTALQRPQYTLAVVPKVMIHGTLAAHEVQDTFSPRLLFSLDQQQLQLLQDSSSTVDLLNPSQAGLLTYSRTEPNTIVLLHLDLAVATARWLALVGLLVSLGGMLILGLVVFQAVRGDEAMKIQLQYGALLIDIHGNEPAAAERNVQVATIDDLARLAERTGGMLLHAVRGTTHHYIVQDGHVSYWYQTTGKITARPSLVEHGAG